MSEKLVKVLTNGEVDAFVNTKHITHILSEKEGWTVHLVNNGKVVLADGDQLVKLTASDKR